jgi:hypothetical protein
MIANVYPEMQHMEETLSTLRFASRVRRVQNEALVGIREDPDVLFFFLIPLYIYIYIYITTKGENAQTRKRSSGIETGISNARCSSRKRENTI